MSDQVPDATQIRAAMAMLSWENDDLAKAADIAASSVHNIKRGLTRPQPRILIAIRAVFEAQGLEFIDNSGVRHRPEGLEELNGYEGFCRFVDGVYEYFLSHGGKVRANGVRNEDWIQYLGKYNEVHISRMEKLTQQRSDIELLHLSMQGEEHKSKFYGGYVKYRFFSPENFDSLSVPFYTYGDNTAILNFQTENPPKILLIKSATVAQTFVKLFDFLWKISLASSSTTATKLR